MLSGIIKFLSSALVVVTLGNFIINTSTPALVNPLPTNAIKLNMQIFPHFMTTQHINLNFLQLCRCRPDRRRSVWLRTLTKMLGGSYFMKYVYVCTLMGLRLWGISTVATCNVPHLTCTDNKYASNAALTVRLLSGHTRSLSLHSIRGVHIAVYYLANNNNTSNENSRNMPPNISAFIIILLIS